MVNRDSVHHDAADRLPFFVEESSMLDFLNGFLPRFLPENVHFDIRTASSTHSSIFGSHGSFAHTPPVVSHIVQLWRFQHVHFQLLLVCRERSSVGRRWAKPLAASGHHSCGAKGNHCGALLSPIDLESLKSEVTGMTIVAPLYSDERSFFSDHEPGVFEVLRAGEFLGYVDADNEVTFPAARTVNPYPEGAASIQLEDLLDPPRTVNLTKIDGRLTRSDE